MTFTNEETRVVWEAIESSPTLLRALRSQAREAMAVEASSGLALLRIEGSLRCAYLERGQLRRAPDSVVWEAVLTVALPRVSWREIAERLAEKATQ